MEELTASRDGALAETEEVRRAMERDRADHERSEKEIRTELVGAMERQEQSAREQRREMEHVIQGLQDKCNDTQARAQVGPSRGGGSVVWI